MSDIEVKRKKGESFDAMFRRWSKRVTQSGKVLNVRARRYHAKAPSKNKLHESALRRLAISTKRDYLLRTGKLVEERNPRRRR